MAEKIKLELSIDEIKELEKVRDTHPLAYVRERAGALLKVNKGKSGYEVALNLLLKERDPDSIYEWIKRFKVDGIKGLIIKPGRGRKPSYAEEHKDSNCAREELLHIVHQEPRQLGQDQSRWSLEAIRNVCEWLKNRTESTICKVLKRLNIRYKRGRAHIHSPDSDYIAKLKDIRICSEYVSKEFNTSVFLFQDELTYYRQPTIAKAYEEVGHFQPLAEQSYKSNTCHRITGVLDAFTGKVIHKQGSKIGVKMLVDFYQQICQEYSQANVIYIVQDNWSIHFHPDVLAALQPQNFKYHIHLPDNWDTKPSSKARYLNLPIQLLPLPTYASWTNPIEKLWKLLKQEVLHLHRYADKWDELKNLVNLFLDQFIKGSSELLRYVDLSDISKLYKNAFIDTS